MFDFHAFARLIATEVATLLAASLADDVLDLDGAAKLLRLNAETVRLMAVSGELPARRLGKVWRFRRAALLEHVTPLTLPSLPQAAD